MHTPIYRGALTLAILVLVTTPLRVRANESAMWLLMPITIQVVGCSGLDESDATQIARGIGSAKKNFPALLPATVWDLLSGLAKKTDTYAQSPPPRAECERFVKLLSGSEFSLEIRRLVAAQLALGRAIPCLRLDSPVAKKVRDSTVSAFSRNGLGMFDVELDEQLKAPGARKPSVSETSECTQFAEYMASRTFDADYSEAGVYKLFSAQ